MPRRPTGRPRGRPPYPGPLTPAETRVLEQVREGLTNAEIAGALDLSPDTVKYHVSNMLAKLGLEDRQALAEWDASTTRRPAYLTALPLALARGARSLLSLVAAHARFASAAGLVILGLAISGLLFFRASRSLDESLPTSTAAAGVVAPSPSASPTPGGTPPPTASPGSLGPTQSATIPPTGSATTTTQPPPVQGLFRRPRPIPTPDRFLTLGTRPSPFSPWDGYSTVIYDVQTGTELDLGDGSLASFSSDSTKAVWSAGRGERTPSGSWVAWLIDLTTGDRTRLGPTDFSAGFRPDGRIVLTPPGSRRRVAIDPTTGERETLPRRGTGPEPLRIAGTNGQVYLVERAALSAYPYLRSRVVVTDAASGALVAAFPAYRVGPAGPGELVVATTPENNATNIFVLDVESRRATYVATSAWAPPNWPLAANDRYVMWTDGYCATPQGKTRLYDRHARQLIELDATLWAGFTPSGLIAARPFGADSLIDPATGDYITAIPGRNPASRSGSSWDITWSPDYRYASHGYAGGHGGLC